MQWHLGWVRASGPSWLSRSYCLLSVLYTPLTRFTQPLLYEGWLLYWPLSPRQVKTFESLQTFYPGKEEQLGKNKLYTWPPLALLCSLLIYCECAGPYVGLGADFQAVSSMPRPSVGVNLHSHPPCHHLLRAEAQPGKMGPTALTFCLCGLFTHLFPAVYLDQLGDSLELS